MKGTPLQAARQAVAANTYHLSSSSGQHGTAPSQPELDREHAPLVEQLVIPRSILAMRYEASKLIAAQFGSEHSQRSFQSVINYLEKAASATKDADFTVEGWWDGWSSRLPDLIGVFETANNDQRRQLVELLDQTPRPSARYQAQSQTFRLIESTVAPARRQIEIKNAADRLRAVFETLKPVSGFRMNGIGPSESARAAHILAAVAPMMPEDLRSRFFVLAAADDELTAGLLNDSGILADTDARRLLNQLDARRQQAKAANLPAIYFATDAEGKALTQMAARYDIPINLAVGPAADSLASYLQALLHNLMGLPADELSRNINFNQLAADIETLMAA